MKRTPTFLFRLLLTVWVSVGFGLVTVQAQMRVGQPAGTPDKSAALDVNGGPYTSGSQYRGIVPPKVSLTKSSLATPISEPAVGLLIYNTAKTGDVIPGYYYWDGTKWLRFNTTTPNGARLGADGDYIPGYTLSGLKALTSPLNNVILVDPGQEGLFRIESSSATDDNGGTVIVTIGGQRYRRVYDGTTSVQKWGVILGANQTSTVRTANTSALQYAVNAGISLFFPEGIIETNGTITVTDNAVKWYGAGQTSVVRQMTDVDLFVIDNTSGNHEPTIEGICFQAGAKFTTATALTIKGILNQDGNNLIQSKPFGHLSRLYFWGGDTYTTLNWTNEWKKNISIVSPNTMTLNDIQIQGAASTKANATIGIEMTTSRAAVETILHNVKINTVTTGLSVTSSNNPGTEGLRIVHCTMAGVYDGITIASPAYQVPLWSITDCHIAAARINISLSNGVQGRIVDCLLYNTGNSDSSNDYASFISLNQCSQYDIINNRCYLQGTTSVINDPYGIIGSAAGPQNQSSYNNISGNYFRLKSGGGKPAIWLQTPWEYSTIQGNYLEMGGAYTILSNNTLSHDNRIYNNYPADATDGNQTISLSPVDPNDDSKGKQLDLTSARSSYIVTPTSATGVITRIKMNTGQRVSIEFGNSVLVKNDLTYIRLAGGLDHQFGIGEVLNLYNTGQRPEEISRKADPANPLTSILSKTMSTSAMTTSAYSALVDPGALPSNKVYLVKLYYNQPGNTVIVQAFIVPIVDTYPGAIGGASPITGTSISYNNDGKQFNLRYTPGPGTMGVEIAPNSTGMSGSLTVTIAPLL